MVEAYISNANNERLRREALGLIEEVEGMLGFEQEELDAIERPVAQARVEEEREIEKCCGHIPTLWSREGNMWVYVCQECGAKQYEEVSQ